MRKKILLFMTLLLSITIFGKSAIRNVTSNRSKTEIIFETEKKMTKNSYKINYDTMNQLIFIEFIDQKFKGKINDKSFVGKSIKDFKYVPMRNNSSFFIQHKPSVTYKAILKSKKLIINFSNQSSVAKKQFTIVIDPGHGGKDPGASAAGKREKDIALKISQELAKNLRKNFNVIMTRNSDVFVNLSQRPKIANTKKADMFISIHANSAKSKKAKGVEVFYFSKKSSPYAARVAAYENSFGKTFGENIGGISQILGELEYTKYQEASAKLAKSINNNLVKNLRMVDRGIHGANFAVLRGLGLPKTVIPGVLIEVGFVSNDEDRKKIANYSSQKKIAAAISEQVKQYFY